MELKRELKAAKSQDEVKLLQSQDAVNNVIASVVRDLWTSNTNFNNITDDLKTAAKSKTDKQMLPSLELFNLESLKQDDLSMDKKVKDKQKSEQSVKPAQPDAEVYQFVNYVQTAQTAQTATSDSQTGRSTQALGSALNPALGAADVKQLFLSNFNRLDKNHDGYVCESEINAAVVDNTFQGQDAQLVVALKMYREELEELSNDEWGDEDDGVTMADMREFDRQQAEQAAGRNITSFASGHFNQLDSDRDGFITRSELSANLLNPAFTAAERRTISEMASRLSDIEEASNDEWGDEDDGITRNDIAQYRASEEHELIGDVVNVMGSTRGRIDRSNRDLYSSPNPLDSIRPAAIQQGGIGDCYFLAALASLAQENPQAVLNMIRDNHNGTYTVTFPGAPESPITVTSPTDSELALYNHGSSYGTWASVIEKAYGTYCNEHWYRRSPLNLGGSDVPQEGADGGSALEAGIRILTGGDVDSDINTFTSYATMDRKLREAFAEGRIVTAYAVGGDEDSRIAAFHEYSVLAYDPNTRTLTLRNPWGRSDGGMVSDGVNDGVFTMSLEEFNDAFTGLAYAERAA